MRVEIVKIVVKNEDGIDVENSKVVKGFSIPVNPIIYGLSLAVAILFFSGLLTTFTFALWCFVLAITLFEDYQTYVKKIPKEEGKLFFITTVRKITETK
jgi:hypothetical protein